MSTLPGMTGRLTMPSRETWYGSARNGLDNVLDNCVLAGPS